MKIRDDLLKIFAFIFILTVGTAAHGLTLVIEPRNPGQVTSLEVTAGLLGPNVGRTTINALNQSAIDYEGSEAGIASIQGLGSQLEVVSTTQMKAWGWCFSVDGAILDVMPDKAPLPPDAHEIKWFYAYALYDSGTWAGYCIQD